MAKFAYFSRILGKAVDHVAITEIAESNTALVIKASMRVGNETKKLFIKTAKRDMEANAYHSKSMREADFYRFIQESAVRNLPIPACYDAFVPEEKGTFLIVLEDISEVYAAPGKKDLRDKRVWFACAVSLARFHAAFWNNESISPDGGYSELDAQRDRDSLRAFLDDFSGKFSEKTKAILTKAMEINIALIESTSRRLREKDNVTVCNGDSHIHNFMLPLQQSEAPLIVDFQFWGEGIGTGDLAHLTRVGFSRRLKREIQLPLVAHYHQTLLECGVTGYAWEDCLRDYRASTASMVLIPFWQYTSFGRSYKDWIGDLRGLIDNYEYLHCDAL